MAKNIALTLTIGGVKQNITNIKELETAIKGAEDQLKGLAIGSEGFKKLSSDVKNAKSVLEDFNQSVQGQDLEKRVGAFAKVGEGITASFAGAQAAISLFGTESEAVAEAAAKAQSVLTIALAARSAAEGVVAVRTVAANIATYASAAAANAATTATRVLWATLAANPFGAILAVVGLLVAAYVSLTGETKEQINVQKELAKVNSDEANNLQNSLLILTKFNGQRELQAREIEKLKKEYPGFNAFIDSENKLNERGIQFIKLKIQQYTLEAKAKLLTQKIAENAIKLLELEQQGLLESVTLWQQFTNFVKSGGNAYVSVSRDIQTGIENQAKARKELTDESKKLGEALEGTFIETDKILTQIKPYNEALNTQVETEKRLATQKENAKKTQDELNQAYKKGVTSAIDFKDQLEALTKAFGKYEDTIKALENVRVEIPVIEDLKKIKQARIEAAQELVDFTKTFDDLVTGVLPPQIDAFGNYFIKFRKELEIAFTKPQEDITKFDKILTSAMESGFVKTQAQRDAVVAVTNGYKAMYDLIEKRPGFKKVLDELVPLNAAWDDNIQATSEGYGKWYELLRIFGDLAVVTGEYKLEIEKTTGEIKKVEFDPVKAKKNADDTYQAIRKGLFEPVFESLLEQKLKSLETQKAIKGLAADQVKTLEGQIKGVTDAIKAYKEKGEIDLKIIDPKQIEQAIDLIINDFNRILVTTVKAEQGVISLNDEFTRLAKDFGKTTDLSKSLGGLVLKNFETIRTEFLGLRTKAEQEEEDFRKKVMQDEEGLANFKMMLAEKNKNAALANDKDYLEAYILFKKKEKEIAKEAEQTKRTEAEKTLRTIEFVFQQFSNSLNQISAVTQERVRTDLEMLKIAEQKALEQVVGDSKTAADKRLEIQADYEEKRKEIEKRGRISALQFSLVQSIANAAQAITALWTNPFIAANPILGAVQTAVIAGVTAAQIGIIQDQISNAQAMRRGGILKAQGGMILRGPSHENGGIPLAQMGVVAEGNEAIINRQSTMNFQGLLSSINQAGGGRPLVMNNFDDSRIVEALAKQQQKPIRAYVLESDITNEQLISKRLESLSKF